jgi:hypothetical protein
MNAEKTLFLQENKMNYGHSHPREKKPLSIISFNSAVTTETCSRELGQSLAFTLGLVGDVARQHLGGGSTRDHHHHMWKDCSNIVAVNTSESTG